MRRIQARRVDQEEQPMAKLDNEKVYYIRENCSSPADYKVLAEELGVDRTTIRRVVTRQTWKHLK